MIPAPFRIALPRQEAQSVALDPVYNALNSLALLNAADRVSSLDQWVTHMAAALTPERLQRNRLVFEGLGEALIIEGDQPDFPSYLAALAARDVVAWRDETLQRIYHGPARAPRDDNKAARPDLLSLLVDRQTFVAYRERATPGVPVDAALQAEAHALLNDPPALRHLIVTHLRDMWETALAREWARALRALQAQVFVFSRSLAPEATVAENFRTFTTRDLPVDVYAEAPDVRQVVFVPSPHVGRYVTRLYDEDTVRLFFGAPPDFGLLLRHLESPIGRTELLVRLGALADETRLRVLALIAQCGETDAREVMTRLDLSQSTASRHLSGLRTAGYLHERRGGGANKYYSLRPTEFDATFRALMRFLEEEDPEAVPAEPPIPIYPKNVSNFVDAGGRVKAWPAKEKDKLAVLDYLASQFEPGREYGEKEVDAILMLNVNRRVVDHVTVRRALCDYRVLERERDGSRYWRAGTRR